MIVAFPGEAIILQIVVVALKAETCDSPSLFEFFPSLLSTGMQGRSPEISKVFWEFESH